MEKSSVNTNVKSKVIAFAALLTPASDPEPGHDHVARREFWDIVSAMRGPDGPVSGISDVVAKQATTAVIRWWVFRLSGLTDEQIWDLGLSADRNADELGYVETRNRLQATDNDGSHFLYHARAAFKALGLKWDELNVWEDPA